MVLAPHYNRGGAKKFARLSPSPALPTAATLPRTRETIPNEIGGVLTESRKSSGERVFDVGPNRDRVQRVCGGGSCYGYRHRTDALFARLGRRVTGSGRRGGGGGGHDRRGRRTGFRRTSTRGVGLVQHGEKLSGRQWPADGRAGFRRHDAKTWPVSRDDRCRRSAGACVSRARRGLESTVTARRRTGPPPSPRCGRRRCWACLRFSKGESDFDDGLSRARHRKKGCFPVPLPRRRVPVPLPRRRTPRVLTARATKNDKKRTERCQLEFFASSETPFSMFTNVHEDLYRFAQYSIITYECVRKKSKKKKKFRRSFARRVTVRSNLNAAKTPVWRGIARYDVRFASLTFSSLTLSGLVASGIPGDAVRLDFARVT